MASCCIGVFPRGGSPAVERSGANLWKALENGVGGNYPADGRFPQVSGLKFSFDYIIYGGDGYVDVFSPAKAKVYGALLDVFVDALKADMAAGKVTKVPALDGRVTKVG